MILAQDVQKLRAMTNCGMMECKNALTESDGDMDKAVELLRKSGAAKAVNKSDRSTGDGLVEAYIHAGGKVGVLLLLNCETDFVAKNELFKELAHELALHIAAMKPLYVNFEDIPQDVVDNERRIYTEQFADSGKPQEVIDKIIDGKMQGYAAETVLLEQSFVKDPNRRIKEVISDYIAKLGENIKVGSFVRYEI
jgi:elongation factor Ts